MVERAAKGQRKGLKVLAKGKGAKAPQGGRGGEEKAKAPGAAGLTAPAWLDRRGKEVWRELSGHIGKALAATDRHALAQLCNGVAKIEAMEKQIREEGASLMSKNGMVQRHPLVGVLAQEQGHVLRLMRLFGLTPGDRDRLPAVEEEVEQEDKTRYFRTG